jgi:hypothetical protein
MKNMKRNAEQEKFVQAAIQKSKKCILFIIVLAISVNVNGILQIKKYAVFGENVVFSV